MQEVQKKWGFAYKKLSDLYPNKKNPRKVSKKAIEKLQKQIKKVGFHSCIKIDNDGVILGGNSRYKALLNFNTKDLEVPVMYPLFELTDAEKQEIIVTDNVNDGEWDIQELVESFDITKFEEWGLGDLGISFEDDDFEEDATTVAEEDKPEWLKLGTFYQIGYHTLLVPKSINKKTKENFLAEPDFNEGGGYYLLNRDGFAEKIG